MLDKSKPTSMPTLNKPHRLNPDILNQLPASVSYQLPADRGDKPAGVGIVHLGIGAFHRAHQAVYTNDVMTLEGGDWRILGVSLRSAGVRDQLQPQGGLYTLVEMDETGITPRVISSIDSVLVAPENVQAVIDALVSPACKVISLTITEKGYCHHPATGRLNQQHPDIVYDLKNTSTPRTAIGYIAEALRLRRNLMAEKIADIPTILCCDNLPNNGHVLKKIVVEYASLLEPELGQWINKHVAFPNTMVDRIVPATSEEDINLLVESYGYVDQGMVKAEAFKQWVIEDNFTAGRPNWEQVGVTIVADVEPFEAAKLRLLNGTHSALAYLGFLAGYDYVHEVVADSVFAQYLDQLMQREIIPTLAAPEGMDLSVYARSLLARYANHRLQHKTYQIAMDGSQKLPQRLLHTIADRLDAGESIDHLAFAVAGWLRYSLGFDERGESILVQDPLSETFAKIEQSHYTADDNLHDINGLLTDYLAIDKIFDCSLASNSIFRERLCFWLSQILANGVSTALNILMVEAKIDATVETAVETKIEYGN